MSENNMQFFRIDKEIQSIKLPLLPRDYAQLEQQLLSEGCKSPLIIWNDILIDGYHRYEICIRHNLPFSVLNLCFPCRQAAIAWICKKQLCRTDLSDEARRFLIGLQCISERAANIPDRLNEATVSSFPPVSSGKTWGNNIAIAEQIANENGIVYASVMRNVLFANALLSLRDKAPLLFSAIFSGKLATTHNDALTLSQMSAEELWRTYQFFQTTRSRNLSYRRLRKVLSTAPQNPPQITQVSSIKDMPAYDPDAEITGLTLTIPSWTSSLARVCKTANLNIVSASARRKLEDTLIDMQNQIFEMLSAIRRN